MFKFTPATTSGSQAGMKKDLKYTPTLPRGLGLAGYSLQYNLKFVPSVMGMDSRVKTIKFSPAWAINKNNDPHYDPKEVNEKFAGYTLDWWTPTAIFNV